VIHTTRLQNFRNYTDDSFEFNPGVNIIVGPNASGKTNLLEAIYIICTQKTYRTNDAAVIRHEHPWARIEAVVDGTTRIVKIHPDKLLEIEIDDKEYKRSTAHTQLPYVLFEPEQLQALVGQPEARREFIDTLIGQLSPQFLQYKKQYRRVLQQRNAMLKTGRSAASVYFVWNVRLGELGGYIATARQQHIETLCAGAPEQYQKFSGDNSNVSLQYESKFTLDSYSSLLVRQLEKDLHKDLARGFTSSGPHRDDIRIEINGHNIQTHASRGEVRSMLLVLKSLEAQHLFNHLNTRPILLLDDVFSELDGRRRKALTELLSDYQTFITTTDADVVVKHFTQNNTIISTTKQ
jgi:DNA replication and repair protein RecF